MLPHTFPLKTKIMISYLLTCICTHDISFQDCQYLKNLNIKNKAIKLMIVSVCYTLLCVVSVSYYKE